VVQDALLRHIGFVPTSPSLRPNVDQALVVMACSQVATSEFDRHNWLELAALCGELDLVENHGRLLRSLFFGDDDYSGHAFDVMRQLLGRDLEHFDTVDRYIGLRSWLAQHDRGLHDQLYEPVSEVALAEPNLERLRDPAAIEAQLQRIRRALEDDFEQAIGSAKDLVEATAKTVLSELGVEYNERSDLPELARAVQRELGLHPEVLAPTSPGAEIVRKILGALATISSGIAGLRNEYGTGHGRGTQLRLQRRHAELAVDAAILYCRTLLATLADPDAPWRTGREGK
jgi:AbiJ N-terminal domain 5/Abortive infection C-terminus